MFEINNDTKIRIPKGDALFLPPYSAIPRSVHLHRTGNLSTRALERGQRGHETSLHYILVGRKRNCIGQSLTMAEMNSVLPRLLSRYKFHTETQGELDYFLTLKYAGARLRVSRITSKQ